MHLVPLKWSFLRSRRDYKSCQSQVFWTRSLCPLRNSKVLFRNLSKKNAHSARRSLKPNTAIDLSGRALAAGFGGATNRRLAPCRSQYSENVISFEQYCPKAGTASCGAIQFREFSFRQKAVLQTVTVPSPTTACPNPNLTASTSPRRLEFERRLGRA